MYFQFEVSVEVERTEGKFMSREEASELIQTELEGLHLDSIEGSDGGSYEVTTFDVQEIEQVKPLSQKAIIEQLIPAIVVLTGVSQITARLKARQFLTLLEATGRKVV